MMNNIFKLLGLLFMIVLSCTQTIAKPKDSIESLESLCGNSLCGGNETVQNCSLDCTEKAYGIYTANLSGENMKLLISDSYRQLNHAYVSPDKKWITFTRYNNIKESNNCAPEDSSGYSNTEILVMDTKGEVIKSWFEPSNEYARVLSKWAPLGDNPPIGDLYEYSITYLYGKVGNLNEIHRLYLDKKMNIVEERIVTIPNVPGPTGPQPIIPVDPHQIGNKISFPGIYFNMSLSIPVRGIFHMNADGSDLKLLTLPRKTLGSNAGDPIRADMSGENDCHISPDGTKIAFMRNTYESNWRVYIVDINDPLNEIDISTPHPGIGTTISLADAVPQWLDNETLLIWHLDFSDMDNYSEEIYTMKINSTEREKIPLPSGYQYNQPSPYDVENSKIIFGAQKKSVECVHP